jgi:hypothetical protein
MRDFITFMKLQEAMEFSQAGKPGSTTYAAPPPPPYNKGLVNQGYPKKLMKVILSQKYISPQ